MFNLIIQQKNNNEKKDLQNTELNRFATLQPNQKKKLFQVMLQKKKQSETNERIELMKSE